MPGVCGCRSLPEGLASNPATGEISGTPSVAGTAFFTVQARDAQRLTGTRSYSLTIYQIDISPPVLPVAYRDQAFGPGLMATGGTEPYPFERAQRQFAPGCHLEPFKRAALGHSDRHGNVCFHGQSHGCQ